MPVLPVDIITITYNEIQKHNLRGSHISDAGPNYRNYIIIIIIIIIMLVLINAGPLAICM